MSNHISESSEYPIGYFFTWATYGTWLPGDQRGWVLYKRGWQLPDKNLEKLCRESLTEEMCYLNTAQRSLVNKQVEETCRIRGWHLYEVNCRSNHMHIVLAAFETHPRKIRASIKSWCTRRLREKFDPKRENWWAERGSIRWIHNQESLEAAIMYVRDAQDR